MLAMLEHGIEQQFIRPRARDLWHATASIDDAIAHIASAASPAPPPPPGAPADVRTAAE
jgi:predicted Rossmann-fold nucleotide-binding protein